MSWEVGGSSCCEVMSACAELCNAEGITAALSSGSIRFKCVGMAQFEIVVERDDLKFCSAHFIAYDGFREKLHGHNYYASIRMTGDKVDLSEDGYLIDFGKVKQAARVICKSWHERLLLPLHSPVLNITSHQQISNSTNLANIAVDCQDGTHFSFPQDDVVLLPIAYTSAEELARHFTKLLINSLGLCYVKNRKITTIEVKIEEGRGQGAIYRVHVEALEKESEECSASIPSPCL